MIQEGISWPFLAVQIFNLTVLLLWIILTIVAFVKMRHRRFGELAHILWIILIIFVPVLGALAFLVTRPGTPE